MASRRSSFRKQQIEERSRQFKSLGGDQRTQSRYYTLKSSHGNFGRYTVRRIGPSPFDLTVVSYPGSQLAKLDEEALKYLAFQELSTPSLPIFQETAPEA